MQLNTKKTVLVFIWVGLLGGLLAIINMGNKIGHDRQATADPRAYLPPPGALEKLWPEVLAHAAAPPQGPKSAPFTLLEFGDFECTSCGELHTELETLVSEAAGKLNFYFVHRPLTRQHPQALSAAEAAQAAAAQGKFWPMYAALYENQKTLSPETYARCAAQAGLDLAKFKAAMASRRYRAQVEDTKKFCERLNVRATPTIVLRNNKTGEVTAVNGQGRIALLLASRPWNTGTSGAPGGR